MIAIWQHPRPRQRAGSRRRIGSAARLCNGPARALRRAQWAALRCALGAALLAAGAGCKPDPPPMQAATDAGAETAPLDAEVDAAPVPSVPVPPIELFRRMPEPPPPIVAVPGDPADGLMRARPGLAPSSYTDKVLVERPADGPFSMIHYQLDPTGRTVQAVLATLAAGYTAPARREALVEAIRLRLGAGEALPKGSYVGHRWVTLPFRVELRTDAATGDLELLYHRRGRVDPTAPQ